MAVPEDKWQTAIRRFTVLKRLLEMDGIERTRAAVDKVAKILKKHPAAIYRWIESYNCSGRLSELLRKNRADRGKSRLSSKVHGTSKQLPNLPPDARFQYRNSN